LIENGKIREAAQLVHGDSYKEEMQFRHEMVKYFSKLDLNQLPYDDVQKKKIRAAFTLSAIQGESMLSAAVYINRLIGETFRHPTLEAYLDEGYKVGMAVKPELFNNPGDVVLLFAHTETMKFYAHQNLERILNLSPQRKGRSVFKGIEISPGDGFCRDCKLKPIYLWDEIGDLPVLPIYPGCQCTYVAWRPRK
jgi:hypothetical protein